MYAVYCRGLFIWTYLQSDKTLFMNVSISRFVIPELHTCKLQGRHFI